MQPRAIIPAVAYAVAATTNTVGDPASTAIHAASGAPTTDANPFAPHAHAMRVLRSPEIPRSPSGNIVPMATAAGTSTTAAAAARAANGRGWRRCTSASSAAADTMSAAPSANPTTTARRGATRSDQILPTPEQISIDASTPATAYTGCPNNSVSCWITAISAAM